MGQWLRTVLAGLCVAAAGASAWRGAEAATSASAVASVRVTVRPSVRMEAVAPPAGVGGVPVGQWPETVTLCVRSNAGPVAVYVEGLSPQMATRLPAGRDAVAITSRAAWDEAPAAVAHYRGLCAEWVPVSGEGAGGGSHEGCVMVTWGGEPCGQLAGRSLARVSVVAMVMPE